MAAWRTRNPKKAQEEEAQSETGAGSQTFSDDLLMANASAPANGSDQAIQSQIPAIAPEDNKAAGWYPDTTDTGLMRYWDGFHFTGQAKRASTREESTVDKPAEIETFAPPASDLPSLDSFFGVASVPKITNLDVPTPLELSNDVQESPAIAQSNHNDGAPSADPAWSSSANYPPLYVGEATGPLYVGEAAATLYVGEAPAPPDVAETHDSPERFPSVVSGIEVESTTATGGVAPAPAETEKVGTESHETAETPVVAPADDDNVSDLDGPDEKENLMDSSLGQGVADGVNNWGKDAELAVARALTVDTPEAWEEAGHIAAVVSEMAQTMQAAADAKQTARETAKAAEEAAAAARVAAQTAVEAKETAERMTKAAETAAEAARSAAQTAVEAKETAERAAQASPKVAETAELASQTAADAKRKAEAIEQVVASARAANTPAAWSEAVGRTAVAVDVKQSGNETFSEPVPDSTPPPVLWRRSTPLGGPGVDSLGEPLGVQGPFGPKDRLSEGVVDVLAELGPTPHLTPAPDGRSAS